MTSIFDRFREELDQFGDRVKDAVESSKLHVERSSLVAKRSKVAYKLGMMVYRKERGTETNQGELDALFAQMDDITEKIAKVDRELDGLDGETVRVDEKPAPEAETGEAEISNA
jgi:seryl-tRNA synthetase